MELITVDKAALLETIKANRDTHRTIFEEAIVGYRERVIEELDRRLADIKQGRSINLAFRFQEPEDHTIEYDRVIRMLEMEVNAQIQLDEVDFSRYVMDDWAWKRAWFENSSNYSATAASGLTIPSVR